MKYLITGGFGFVVTNLADRILKEREELIIVDNFFRYGTHLNYEWLKSKGDFKFYHADIRDYLTIEKIIKDEKPDVIFHLAGQVAMTTSLLNPYMDFEINAIGSLNVLESVRKHSLQTIIIYSSEEGIKRMIEWSTLLD